MPGKKQGEEEEEHELKVWVSTSSGLQRVERKGSSNSNRLVKRHLPTIS